MKKYIFNKNSLIMCSLIKTNHSHQIQKKIVQGSTTIQVASTNQSRLVIIYNTAMDVVVVIG
jgi:hypothetical protein